jgi:threonine/homoserine/homoserine lactone efflux protein
MDLAGLLIFVTTLFIAAASPGPGIAALVARVLGLGPRGGVAFAAGMALGDVVWLTVAIVGLAALAQAFQGIFAALKYAGAAYLLVIAWKLWTAPAGPLGVKEDARDESSARLALGGLALTLGNPKTIMFYMALLPTMLDLGRTTAFGYVELVAATLLVLSLVFGGYILLAARVRQVFTTARAARTLNRSTGAIMVGAAVAIAAR